MKDSEVSTNKIFIPKKTNWKAYFIKYWMLYVLLLPVLAYFIIFKYLPMYGIIIAFKRYIPTLGVMGSPWVGWRNFESFFKSAFFFRTLRNTVLINTYGLIFGWWVPIFFALLLNELKNIAFKRTVQTISYLPHFISLVVVTGMLIDFLASDGIISVLMEKVFGLEARVWLQEPSAFRIIYVASGIWQGMGWSAIIYIAALSSISPALYEAATLDGAGTFRKMWHVSIPGILPTILILLILRMGQMLNVGVEKIILLYNQATYETGDVIASFIYRRGFVERPNPSLATAVELFNQLVNLTFLVLANAISRRVSETSLW